jgi:SagB-type dehydrogenase family enzyme
MPAEADVILPPPRHKSDVSLEETLLRVKSVRRYSGRALTLSQLSQLLWAAQGIKNAAGKRTAPSAGATYPLEVYAVVGSIEGIASGIYKYDPFRHGLAKGRDSDFRQGLSSAASDQRFIARAPLDIVIAAVYQRTTGYYGQRGVRYVDMEAGHAAQNVCLQAVALGLGAVVVGAFDDDEVAAVLELPDSEMPLYIIPVGGITD